MRNQGDKNVRHKVLLNVREDQRNKTLWKENDKRTRIKKTEAKSAKEKKKTLT